MQEIGYNINVPRIEDLCNGSTPDSDSVCGGSNPSSSAKKESHPFGWLFFFAERDSNPSKCKAPVVPCSPPAGRRRHLNVIESLILCIGETDEKRIDTQQIGNRIPVAGPDICLRRRCLGICRPLHTLMPCFICHGQRRTTRPLPLAQVAPPAAGGAPITPPHLFFANAKNRTARAVNNRPYSAYPH